TQQRRIAGLRKALLVLHSPDDEIVEIDNAARIYQAAKHPKSFVSLDGADHMLTDPRDIEFAADTIAVWAGRYIINKLQYAAKPGQDLAEKEVLVEETGNGYTNNIYTAEHRLVADEPAGLGGNDLGPDPYRLLLAALGACTSITLRMYAQHKKLPLDKVSVRLRHEKVHARDCKDCLEQQSKMDHIWREIILEGQLDTAQRQRLLEIAEHCPVHKTLESKSKIMTKLNER
ncbi:MAG TPA: bifunctional alpha/beta hydrolase/OsmC family protein, partial [Gammaproteobacteria bacterium]